MEQSTSPILNIATFGHRISAVLGSAENDTTIDGRRADPSESKTFVATENRTTTSSQSLVQSARNPAFDEENNCPPVQNADVKKPKLSEFPIIRHSLTTTHQRHKVDKARQRPSVGGKSVAAMRHLNKAGSHKRGASGWQLSTEQLKLLSRRIDPSAPLSSPHASPSKPALPQSLSPRIRRTPSSPSATIPNHRPLQITQSPLFQTCTNIWSGSQPQQDLLHYNNIKQISEFLKVRLAQAKYRALDSLDSSLHYREDNHDISGFLLPKRRKLIQLTHKRHQLSLTVSGSGRNLFDRKHNDHRYLFPPQSLLSPHPLRPDLTQEEGNDDTLITDGTGKVSTFIVHQPSAPTRGRKANGNKRKSAAERTPKRTYSSKTLSPVILEDGSRVFVCEPCGKRYKNRNGLTYHLDRCRNRQEEQENSQQQDELVDEDHGNEINCICNTPSEDRGTIVQCDKCRSWQHAECINLEHDSSSDGYVCAQCFRNDDSESTQQNLHEEMEEEEDELEDDDDSACDQPGDCVPIADATVKETTAVAKSMDEDVSLSVKSDSMALTPTGECDGDNIQQQNLSETWANSAADSQEDTSFSSFQDPAFQPWSMSDLGLIHPPSLLFSDSTAFDDETNLPPSDIVPTETSPADALWFEFANFEDDYHCDEL